MSNFEFLQDLVVIFGVALVVVAALRRIGVPSIAGFIIAGVIAGPSVLRLVDDVHQVEVLAEVGVVLLLFGIGLELSLDRLKRLWKAVLAGGAAQVGLTIGLTMVVSLGFGLPLPTAIFVGCIVAVSSTAIVLRGLSVRGELEAPHGKLSLAILVFQDLCVVPMILVIPLLSGNGGSGTDALAAIGIAVGLLAGILILARLIVPRVLAMIARTRQRDLFVLAVFVVCFGIAWAVSGAGISLALGAFLAGLVVAGSEYRHQALADLIPLREVFASLFFVSIGMLLDVRNVITHLAPILGMLAAIMVGKFIIVAATAAFMRLSLRASVMTGAALCQVGEFSFVLFRSAHGTGLLNDALAQNLLVAIILSMLITPVAIALGPRLATGAARVSWLEKLLRIRTVEQGVPQQIQNHTIIAGYGITGQQLAAELQKRNIPYVVADLNAEVVRSSSAHGWPVFYGDVTSPEILHSLGLEKARALVLAVNDPGATMRAIKIARTIAPDLWILARTQYAMDERLMSEAGASVVISAEAEAANRVMEVVGPFLDRGQS